MASNPPQNVGNLTKITIDNRNMQDMAENLRFAVTDIARFARALKGAMGDNYFFTTGMREIGQKGQMSQDFFVPREMAKVAMEALKREAGAILGSMVDSSGNPVGRDYYVASRATNVARGTVNIAGEDAFKDLRNKLRAIGGEAYREDVNRPDDVSFYYPTNKKKGSKQFITEQESLLSNSMILSARELRIRADALTVETNKSLSKAQKDEEKALAKEAKEKAQSEAKEMKEDSRKRAFLFTRIIAIATLIADITRRILTSILSFSTKVKENAILGASLGVNPFTIFRNSYVDTAHGLATDTTNNAIQDIQSKFGNVTSIDENSLAELARVMGESVSDAVRSGLGGKNAEELLNDILEKYIQQFIEGKNSLGQTVGQEQALRELVTSLSKVSPSLAMILSSFGNDFLRNPFSSRTYEEWTSSVTDNLGLTLFDKELLESTSDALSLLKSNLSQLSDTITGKLMLGLSDFIAKLNGTLTGMSAQDRSLTFLNNKTKAQRALGVLEANESNNLTALSKALKEEGIDYDIQSNGAKEFLLQAGFGGNNTDYTNEQKRRERAFLFRLKYGKDEKSILLRTALMQSLGFESIEEDLKNASTDNTGSAIFDSRWTDTTYTASQGNILFQKAYNDLSDNINSDANNINLGQDMFMDIATKISLARDASGKFNFNSLGEESISYLNDLKNNIYKRTKNNSALDWVKGANKKDPILSLMYALSGTSDKESLTAYLGGIDSEMFMNETLANFIAYKNQTPIKANYSPDTKKASSFYKIMIKDSEKEMEENINDEIFKANAISRRVISEIIGVEGASSASYTVNQAKGDKKAKLDVTFYNEKGTVLGKTELTVDTGEKAKDDNKYSNRIDLANALGD